jgi:hypothetical protein
MINPWTNRTYYPLTGRVANREQDCEVTMYSSVMYDFLSIYYRYYYHGVIILLLYCLFLLGLQIISL